MLVRSETSQASEAKDEKNKLESSVKTLYN